MQPRAEQAEEEGGGGDSEHPQQLRHIRTQVITNSRRVEALQLSLPSREKSERHFQSNNSPSLEPPKANTQLWEGQG